MKNNFSCLHVRKLEEEEEEGGTRDLGTARRRGAPGTKKGGEIIISSSSGKSVSFRVRTVEAPFFTRPPPLSDVGRSTMRTSSALPNLLLRKKEIFY